MRYLAFLSLALLAGPPVADAQASIIDEGSFTISRGGARLGRESFTIRRTPGPGGATLVANATVDYDAQRLSPALRTDSTGAPLAYQVEVKTGADVQERLSGQIGRGRFSARVRTPKGESAKEYLVSDGALVLDDDVFHQYYFVAHANRSGAVPVVVPRRNVQLSMRVQTVGDERVEVGGSSIQARHLSLTGPGGDARQLWVDARGRVLKVSLDSQGIIAMRDEPPE